MLEIPDSDSPREREKRTLFGLRCLVDAPRWLHLLCSSAGLCTSFVLHGYMQERFARYHRGNFLLMMTAFELLGCVIPPFIQLLVINRGSLSRCFATGRDVPTSYFASIATLLLGSLSLGNLSLRYVSFPIKVILKSSKLLPVSVPPPWAPGRRRAYTCTHDDTWSRGNAHARAHACEHARPRQTSARASTNRPRVTPPRAQTMLVGTFYLGKAFTVRQYFAAALLCGSVVTATFANADSGQQSASQAETTSVWSTIGVAMLFIAVSCDSISPVVQEKLMRGLDVHPAEMMLRVNGMALVALAPWWLLDGTELAMLRTTPGVPMMLLLLSLYGLTSFLGVSFMLAMIDVWGSATGVAIGTLRKLVTIIVSFVAFPKPLSPLFAVAGATTLAAAALTISR